MPDGSRKPLSIAVGALLGRLDELHASGLELLVGGAAVVGREEDRPREALGHHGSDLVGGVGVHHRRARDRHQHDRDVRLPRRTDRQPAEAAQLRQRHVHAHLPAELLGVERERLVLVVHPQLGVGDPDHVLLLFRWNRRSPARLDARAVAVFSKRAVLRAPERAQDAGRNQRVLGRRRECPRGRRSGSAVGAGEAGRERADALQPDRRGRCRRRSGRSSAASPPRARGGASAGRRAGTRRTPARTRG